MSDADCEYYLETLRQRRQRCCKYEPRFDSPDNIMFHTSSDVLWHDPNEYCSQYGDYPHDADKCGFWAQLNVESAVTRPRARGRREEETVTDEEKRQLAEVLAPHLAWDLSRSEVFSYEPNAQTSGASAQAFMELVTTVLRLKIHRGESFKVAIIPKK